MPTRGLILSLENTLRDLKLSFRTFARNPGFTVVVIMTRALGIGVNTGVFTLVDTLLYRPVPVPDPHQIVSLGSVFRGRENSNNQGFSFPVYLTIREASHIFSGLIAQSLFSVHLSADGFTERLDGEIVSANYTEVLGIEPGIGRGFLPEEGNAPGQHAVAMISDRLWRERFHGSREIVGKTVRVNGHPFTLVGVMPAHFKGIFGGQDVWVPMMMQPQVLPPNRIDNVDYSWLRVIGRLKPEINLESAQSSLAAVVSQLELEDSGWKNQVLRLAPGHRGTRGEDAQSEIRSFWIILVAIMGSVLFIACTNVASLLLSHARGRRLEMAIRLASGATRRSLVRYLLTETTVLFLAGGAAAVLVAPWFMAMTGVLSLPRHLTRLMDGTNLGMLLPDSRTLLFTLFLSATTAIIFGLAPAAQASRIDLFSELRTTEPVGRFRSGRWRHGLVTLQVALSLTMLVVAGLFLRSLANRLALDPDFDPANVVTLSVDVAKQGYNETKGVLFLRQLLRRAETAPGVNSVSLAQFVPADSSGVRTSIRKDEDEVVMANVNSICPGYFETVRLPLIRGRDFQWTDDHDARPVTIVSQTLAERFWPDANPIGKQVSHGSNKWMVIGVAGEVHFRMPGENVSPHVYFPILQGYVGNFTLMARTQPGQITATMASMRQAVRELDADLPTFGPQSLSATIAARIAEWRLLNLLLGSFGLLALILACVGLYGVLSHSVARRTREIAVRLAMGARHYDTVWLILRRALVVVAIGLSVGAGLALAGIRILRNVVAELEPSGPVVFLVPALVIVVASLLACWIPAYRITRLEPMEALRHE